MQRARCCYNRQLKDFAPFFLAASPRCVSAFVLPGISEQYFLSVPQANRLRCLFQRQSRHQYDRSFYVR